MRNFTLLFTLLICSVGFGQTVLSDYSMESDRQSAPLKQVEKAKPIDRNAIPATISTEGITSDRVVIQRSIQLLEQDPTEIQRELDASNLQRAANPPSGTYVSEGPQTRSMANIIPNAGATETFAVVPGDFFYDPTDGVTGGPGGDCSTTSSGNPGDYPNCGCVTTTTLTGTDLEVEFLVFRVFGTFDFLNIYDGPDTASPQIYDSNLNSDTDTLAGMITANGSAVFTSTTGALTFEFSATAVVNTCGWEVEVLSGGGGGGVCPAPMLEINQDVEDVCMANISQTDLAQSYIPIETESAGAGVKFTTASTGEDLTLSLWDALPNAGGTMLATGTTVTTGDVWADVFWDPVVTVTPGNTYFITIEGTVTSCVAGSINDPYPDGEVYANPGYQQFPNFDYTFRTYSCDGGGGGTCTPGSLTTTFAGGNGNFGNMFDVNSLTDLTIDSFDIHGDTGATFDVEVYAKAGTYVGFETDPGAWTLIGTAPGVVSNGDGVATPLNLTLGYAMAAGETHAFYVTPTDFTTGGFNYTNGTAVGNVFASDANIEFLEGSGSGYPFNGTLFSPRVWNGNILYCVDAADPCINTTFVAGGLPADIDPGGTSTTDCAGAPNDYPVTVGDPGTIGVDSNIDNVTLTITHTFDGDLDIWLVSPAGTELILSDQNGGGGDNFIDTVFMDGAGPLSGGAPPYTGTFEPDGGTFAAAFDGEDIQGDWLLRICDRFGGDTGTVDAFSISICRPEPPDNDVCAEAFPIACGDVVVSETITNTDTGGNPAPDEWYSFTGSGSPQVVTLSLCDGGTDYDSFLRVFDACGGTEIAANDDSCGLQSELSFLSDGTSTYYIMVEGFASNSGNFSLAVTCVDPPPNDECAGAISMDCGDTVVGETNTATFDASAPVCVTGITAPGVWYEFTDTTGLVTNYTLSMCDGGTDYDSKITVYSGDCGALACVVDNDDTCGLQSEVSWQGDGSTTYYILVHGFGSATGNFSMALTCAPVPPPNDMIVNSIDVDEIGFPYTDPAVAMPAATTENGNPAGCNLDGANGVWYNFVPDGDGFATAEIITPGGASAVTFYSAPDENSTETDLTLVDWNGNQCVPGTSAIIPTVAGQAYYVFVLNSGAITDIVIDGNNLGVNDNAIQGFTYHPNPTDGVLNLNSVENIDSVAIYNILGQQVLNQTIDATSTQLDVSNLAVGAYVMKVSVNGETGTYKIIKR